MNDFTETRRKLERMFEDVLIECEKVTSKEGMVITSMSHHSQKIIDTAMKYIDEIEDAYLNGVFMAPNTSSDEE